MCEIDLAGSGKGRACHWKSRSVATDLSSINLLIRVRRERKSARNSKMSGGPDIEVKRIPTGANLRRRQQINALILTKNVM